jgi:alpha-tubulin suppressor-like RCC1 family protein
MKVPLLSLFLVSSALSLHVCGQTPKYIACPGEYQVFFIKSADNSAYAMGGGVASLGIGSNTGAQGTPIPMAFPAGVKIKQISSPLHNGMAVDLNGNVWFWGLNDGGQRGDGTVDGAISYSPVQVMTDSLGNPFTNVNQISSWWNETNAVGTLACKNDGTVWIWGNTIGGMRGNGQYGQENPKPVQVNIPGNPHIVKVLAGEICMALDNNGNVYTWGGNGRTDLLGTNNSDYTNVRQVPLPKPAKDIAGSNLFDYALATDGTLYGWGIYGAYLGIGTGTYLASNTFQALPVDLTSQLSLPKPIASILCNSVCTHVILTDSTLWGWGDNTQGDIGNGIMTNWATYPTIYAWDWGAAEILQHKPVQIAPLVHNFTTLFAGTSACFYMYAETATGQLYSWGRNKSVVLGNQVVNATSDIQASYPDGWDQPTITAVNPFALTASTVYPSTCPYCLLNPTSSPCNEFTIPANVKPVSVPGANQTITLPTSTTILDGSGSHDPDGTVVYYKWRQVSGPSANTVLDSTYSQTRIAGLVAGTYVFRLTVKDNGWDTSGAAMTVVVSDASGHVPPTVSAGSNQTIELPTSSVILTGTATGNGGATISSTAWTEVSGPATATIASAGALSTGVSGLTTAGTYVFQLQATDNNGQSGTGTVSITVQPAPSPNVPPTVTAGSNQTIQQPASSVTLTGTARGNGGATIVGTTWTEMSGPATATIANAAALSTGVTGLSTAGAYVFELKATDNNGLHALADVTITVETATVPPPIHVPPVADAGPNQTVNLPFTDINLNGTGSSDEDGTISTYSWVQVSGNGGVTIVGSSQAQPSIYGLTPGTYVFRLTVTDNYGASASATVTITVNAASTQAPVANAGTDTTIALPDSLVVLTGTGSSDPGGEALTYQWSQVSGPSVAIMGSATGVSTTAGQLKAGLYIFQLKVTNTSGLSGVATVEVRVLDNQRSAGIDSGNAEVLVYPNPVPSMLTVKLTDPSTSGQVLIRVISMRGVQVMQQEAEVTGAVSINFNVSGLAKGVYGLQVIVGMKQTYQLIVKQ